MAMHFALGLEITVVDQRVDASVGGPAAYTGPAASAARLGTAIPMTDIPTVVAAILARIGAGTGDSKKIARLNVLDHGSPSGFEMGDDHISMGTLPTKAVELAKLAPHFARGGFAHLQHCEIGQNPKLVAAVARLLGVPVYAGVGYHNPVYRVNFGGGGWMPFEHYIRCDPDGTVLDPATRPELTDPGDIKLPLVTPFGPVTIPIWDR